MWSVLKLYLYFSCKNIKDNAKKKKKWRVEST